MIPIDLIDTKLDDFHDVLREGVLAFGLGITEGI